MYKILLYFLNLVYNSFLLCIFTDLNTVKRNMVDVTRFVLIVQIISPHTPPSAHLRLDFKTMVLL